MDSVLFQGPTYFALSSYIIWTHIHGSVWFIGRIRSELLQNVCRQKPGNTLAPLEH